MHMRATRLTTVLGSGLALAALAACSAAPGPTPVTTSPTVLASESPAPDAGTCLDVEPYPDVPVHELNATLPVDALDAGFSQSELQLWRGDTSACGGSIPTPIVAACSVTEIDFQNPTPIILWRGADQLAAAIFAEGATGMLYEEVSGGTTYGGVFRYQLTAWRYPTEAAAAESGLFDLVTDCGGTPTDLQGLPALALAQGGDPFLVAYRVGAYVYTVDNRIGPDENGVEHPLADTETGRLPAQALSTIATWWATHGVVADNTASVV